MARYGLWVPIPMWVGGTQKWIAGRAGRRLTAVVIHRMEGSLEGSDSYLRRERADYYPYPRLNASTHFGVGLWNGVPQIRQWVDTANTAWGWSARPTDTPTALARNTLYNLYNSYEDLNWQVISVEVEGFAYQSWDYRTTAKVKELLGWIYRTHGNLVIMAHTDCSTKPCPGMATFQAALPGYYGNRLGNIFGTAPAPTPPPSGVLNMPAVPGYAPPAQGKVSAGVNLRTSPNHTIANVYRRTDKEYFIGVCGTVTGTVYNGSSKWILGFIFGRFVYVHSSLVRSIALR